MARQSRLSVHIYVAKNKEWSYRVVRGSRVILTAHETYKLRGGVRRAVRNLATISLPLYDKVTVTPLAEACFAELDAEMARWKDRPTRIVLDQP